MHQIFLVVNLHAIIYYFLILRFKELWIVDYHLVHLHLVDMVESDGIQAQLCFSTCIIADLMFSIRNAHFQPTDHICT